MKRNIIFPLILLMISSLLFPETNGLTVISPNGGEKLTAGSPFQVLWNNNSETTGGNVILVLYKEGIKYLTITESAPDTGNFIWQIPADIDTGDKYRIRIRSAENLDANDFSDSDFSIQHKK